MRLLFSNLLFEVESLRAGLLQPVLPLDSRMSWVAPRDIAEVAALALLNPVWRGRRVQAVHSPEDLSWAQVAEILTDELGREVRVKRITDEQMRERYLGAGMPPALAEALLGMSTGLRDDFEPEQALASRTSSLDSPSPAAVG